MFSAGIDLPPALIVVHETDDESMRTTRTKLKTNPTQTKLKTRPTLETDRGLEKETGF